MSMPDNAPADMLEAAGIMEGAAEQFASAVACFGEFLGMDAENTRRERDGLSPAYEVGEFIAVAERYNLPTGT